MPGTAYLFPGQGVQDREHAAVVHASAPDLLAVAAQEVGDDPFERCGESTRYAQPAIVLASLAAWRETDAADAVAFAGHSLGELTALAAADAIDEVDAVRLAVLRGELMAQAADRDPGGTMLAVLGGTPEQSRDLADDFGLTIANDNAPGQLVLAGRQAAIDGARRAARTRKLRALQIDVSGAFHSPQMLPARAPWETALSAIPWRTPRLPVFSGFSAAPLTDPVGELSAAVVSPVRWREVMLALRESGIESFVDVGPGEVLARITNRMFGGVGDGVAAAA